MSADPATTLSPRVARVLLDSGLPQLDHLFDYEIPEPLRGEIRVGHRVKVPFRSRQRDSLGYVIELTDTSEFPGELAVLSSIVSPVPMLTPEVWNLVRAVADRAGGSAADLIRLAVPNRHVRTEKAFLAAREAVQDGLWESGDGTPAQESLATRLTEGARVAFTVQLPPVRLPTGEWVSAWAHELAQIALDTYAQGRSVIITVPDHRDLDQVHDTLQALGHDAHVRLDSRQTAADRYGNFLRALEPRPCIVLGNRSAIYAPAYRLGAILIWNDGDPLFEEPLTPYVHTRDAALVRSQQSNAGLLVASHVPTAEMQRLIDMQYVTPIARRAPGPKIMHSGSMAGDEIAIGRIPELATRMLRQGLQDGPVLVQVAAPGYALALACTRCRDLARCTACKGPMTQATSGQYACRWCGQTATTISCETCGANTFELRGAGSERTAAQFEQMFPETMIILSDGKHQRSRVDARSAVVVATRGAEPIPAGGYRAVVLLDVDRLVTAPSLRAGEDALRWWHGATALAQADAPVVITGGAGQVVRAFVTGRETAWLREELRDRHELRFPPAVRVATVSGARELVQEALEAIDGLTGVDMLGPVALHGGTVRATIRFGYAMGTEVAARLRAVLVAQAASRTARAYATRKQQTRPGGQTRGAPPGTLRLRFDDALAFDDRGDEES